MDIKTLILALSFGNAIFCSVLYIFQRAEATEQRNSDWTRGKLLQSIGWFLLYWRGTLPVVLSFTVGNIILILGIAYETWAILRIAGLALAQKFRTASFIAVIAICAVVTPLESKLRIAAASFTAASFFAATGWVLLRRQVKRSPLRITLGWSICFVALIIATRSVLAFSSSEFHLFTDNLIQKASFLTMLAALLINGFGILLLTKEEADQAVCALSREQHAILEALPTGLCIMKDRVIYRCNPAIDVMFGFAPGALVGRTAACLFESEQKYREYGREMYASIERFGFFWGEVEYVRQNGEKFWALDHAVPVFPGVPDSFVVFSVTDISEQKRQQELLTRQKEELQETLARTKSLEGMISICMHCKKIHDNNESWEQLETYLTENSDAQFSHGICPDCYKRHYSEQLGCE
ncbi:PAS domain-containing protein [Geomonas oryzisoli]|uniref:PAS domain-containing protein n=1 Tax=Geomonas oryzisoli TaxID=2847992 RepID=A0ABX8J6J6_9BACT|nr:PAS domain-containing protein [Geomonas oryzisoli]QWV92352.1 PAS domain-containing protein [Geomonas oryzisoli]